MDQEKVLRKINRQLRGIKAMLGFFALVLLIMLGLLGFVTYKVVTFTHQVNDKMQSIEQLTKQKLDLKSGVCGGDVMPDIAAGRICQ